jgi:hypothetical protein
MLFKFILKLFRDGAVFRFKCFEQLLNFLRSLFKLFFR